MATKEKKVKPSEPELVDGWRRDQFQRLLPKRTSAKKLDALVASTASPHDLKKLLDRECPPKTAIDILI
jgi:hypothetical protein